MDHEPDVGVVVPHAQRRGGDDDVEVVGRESILDRQTDVGVSRTRVHLDLDVVRLEPSAHPVRVRDREAVDDPDSVELGEMLCEPCHPIVLVGQVEDLEGEALPLELAALDRQVRAQL